MWLVGHVGIDSLAANTSGTYAAMNDFNGMLLWRKRTAEGSASHFPGQLPNGRSDIRGEDIPSGCRAELWIDDHNLVCSDANRVEGRAHGTNFFKITMSSNYRSVVDVQPLLPATDRENSTPVVSPDRTAIAFVSSQGNQKAIFHQDLKDGAEPRNLLDLVEEAPTDEEPITYKKPVIIAWL